MLRKILLLFIILYSFSFAQQQGTLVSIPTNKPVKGLVQLTNLATHKQYNVLSDAVTGQFTLNLSDGEYERKIYVPGNHFMFDTIKISGSNYQIKEWWYEIAHSDWQKKYGTTRNWNIQTVEYKIATTQHPSTKGKSIFEIYKLLTGEIAPQPNGSGGLFVTRMLPPYNIYLRRNNPKDSLSMPTTLLPYILASINDVNTRLQGAAALTEVTDTSIAKILQYYPTSNGMPVPGAVGYTSIATTNFELIKSWIYIANDNIPSPTIFTESRELGRGWFEFLDNFIYNPEYIMCRGDVGLDSTGLINTTGLFHDDEIQAARIKMTFNIGTYVCSYQDSLITDIPNVTVGVEKRELIYSFNLYQNFPNPFNPTTVIKYELPKSSFVTIKIFDMLGREIKTLLSSQETPGNHEITFDGKELPSGVYVYRIQAGGFIQCKKMVMMK